MIYDGPEPTVVSVAERETTSNRMELRVAIEGLKRLEAPSRVRPFGDSAYLVNGFEEGWVRKCERNGWRTSVKKPVKDADLWRELVSLSRRHAVDFEGRRARRDRGERALPRPREAYDGMATGYLSCADRAKGGPVCGRPKVRITTDGTHEGTEEIDEYTGKRMPVSGGIAAGEPPVLVPTIPLPPEPLPKEARPGSGLSAATTSGEEPPATLAPEVHA